MFAIEIRDLCKKYRNKVLFDQFSLTVEKGEMIAVMGDSGKGKSTLLNMIGLLESPDSGMINILGKNIVGIKNREASLIQRNVIGYLFQNYALVDNLTVDKNLDIALEYANVTDRNEAKLAALKRVQLESKYKDKIFELSGGEQQRIAIARLMLKPCEIVLADEPTGSLDVHNRDIVIGLLREIHQQGKTILIVTHDKNVADICQRVVNL